MVKQEMTRAYVNILGISELKWNGMGEFNSDDHYIYYPLDHGKSKRVPEKHLFHFIDYAKAFDCVDHNKLWEILKEMEYQTT